MLIREVIETGTRFVGQNTLKKPYQTERSDSVVVFALWRMPAYLLFTMSHFTTHMFVGEVCVCCSGMYVHMLMKNLFLCIYYRISGCMLLSRNSIKQYNRLVSVVTFH